jgi:hypothetical protein
MAYYCTATDVIARLSAVGYAARLDDNPAAIKNVLQDATNKMRMYLEPIYNPTDLVADAQNGGWTNDRAVDIATGLLCRRRANPMPDAVKEAYQEAIESVEGMRRDDTQIPGIKPRHSMGPTFSNIRVDPRYIYRRIRVETQQSEHTAPTGYAQAVEWSQAGSPAPLG